MPRGGAYWLTGELVLHQRVFLHSGRLMYAPAELGSLFTSAGLVITRYR